LRHAILERLHRGFRDGPDPFSDVWTIVHILLTAPPFIMSPKTKRGKLTHFESLEQVFGGWVFLPIVLNRKWGAIFEAVVLGISSRIDEDALPGCTRGGSLQGHTIWKASILSCGPAILRTDISAVYYASEQTRSTYGAFWPAKIRTSVNT
jgi:hypothetical protein